MIVYPCPVTSVHVSRIVLVTNLCPTLGCETIRSRLENWMFPGELSPSLGFRPPQLLSLAVLRLGERLFLQLISECYVHKKHFQCSV